MEATFSRDRDVQHAQGGVKRGLRLWVEVKGVQGLMLSVERCVSRKDEWGHAVREGGQVSGGSRHHRSTRLRNLPCAPLPTSKKSIHHQCEPALSRKVSCHGITTLTLPPGILSLSELIWSLQSEKTGY